MVVIDVPVQADKGLHVRFVAAEVVVGTGVIAVLVHDIVLDPLHVGHGGAGNEKGRIGYAVGRGLPAGSLLRMGDVLEVDEVEELVLDDGAAEGHTIGSGTLRVTFTELESGNVVSAHEFVPVIDIGRTLDGVGTGLGDGVDTTADEVGLADVVRRDDDLHFLDGIQGDGVAAAREVSGKTEVVVEVTTVDGEVRGTVIGTHEGHAVSSVRREPGHIGEVTADSRKGNDLAVVDIGCRTCLLGGELGRCRGDDDGFGKHLGIVRHLGVECIGLTKEEGDVSIGN